MAESMSHWMSSIARTINQDVELKDYKVTSVSGAGPRVFVTVHDGEGDTSALRNLRTQLMKILKDEVKGKDGFEFKITAANKGDDMVVTCEILYP